MAEVEQRLKQALRSNMSNDSDKPDQVTSLTLLIRALRADLGHMGTPMVLIDFSELGPQEILATVGPAAVAVRSRPPKSVATITKVDGASFDSEVIAALKTFAKSNEPHVRAAAIVGLTGMQRIVLSAVSQVTGRAFLLCGTVEDAKSRLLPSA